MSDVERAAAAGYRVQSGYGPTTVGAPSRIFYYIEFPDGTPCAEDLPTADLAWIAAARHWRDTLPTKKYRVIVDGTIIAQLVIEAKDAIEAVKIAEHRANQGDLPWAKPFFKTATAYADS
ncbi:MAG: hypothetical protein ACREEW_14460 [Caulobacteraceae bacterium]